MEGLREVTTEASIKAKEKYFERPWLKFYPEFVPREVDISEKLVSEILDEAVEKYKDRTAVIFYGEKISYRELKEQIDKLATALHDLGIRKGDRVALLLLNCPQYIIAFFAVAKIGAIISSISPVYSSSEIKYQLENSGSEVIICQDLLYNRVEKTGVKLKITILTSIGEYLPKLKKFMGESVLRAVYRKMEVPSVHIYQREGIYSFQELIKKYPPKPLKIEINPKEDIVALPYSGGTTGLPKGIMLTHYNFVASHEQWLCCLPCEDGKEIILNFLPFFHIYGQAVLMFGGLVRGYTIVVFSTPDPDDILIGVEKYEATAFFSVPTMYESLKDHEKTNRVNWKRLKFVYSGADTLLEDTAKSWERRTGTKIIEGWGMTETSGGMHITPFGRIKVGSWGCACPGTMAAVINPNEEKIEFVPFGEIGELIVKGPSIMKGYWNNPEETRKALVEIDGETWLRTGDLVRMDEEGYIFFYDRKRDMIKYKGYSIFAREVEEVLATHPKIKKVAVVGVPDPKVGEWVKAAVVLESDARGKISEEEIVKYCEENLAHYKIPKIVEFRGEIPKTDAGKVSRREIREESK